MILKIYLAAFLLCFSLVQGAAQSIVKGKVTENKGKDAVPFANVALLRLSDSLAIAGVTAAVSGTYELEVAPGDYILSASFFGYQTALRRVAIQAGTNRMKAINLSADVTQLEEVQVEAAAALFSTDFDKKVFNLENSSLAEGGSAVDLLETLPSITVDEEGGLSLRGSGDILIYINGRQTNLSGGDAESVLAQFPANAIESVELITNPSSRYDAAGVGGIINIVLKKGQMKGLNGQVNTSVGTNNKYQAGLNLNYRTERVNYYANYNFQYRELWQVGETKRFDLTGNTSAVLDQNFNTLDYFTGQNFRLGADIDLTEKQVLSFFASGDFRPGGRTRDYNNNFQNLSGRLDSGSTRNLIEEEVRRNVEVGSAYSYVFDKEGHRLDALATFSIDEVDRTEFFEEQFFTGEQVVNRESYQVFGRPRFTQQIIAQLDYQRPITETARLDVGAKSTLRFFDRLQTLDEGPSAAGPLTRNDFVSDEFDFNEDVHAAYLTYRDEWKNLKFQLGLRGELSLTESYQPKIDSTYVNNYFDFFPSIYFDYNLGKERSLLLNYSRRISRPGTWSLAPLVNVQDPLNIRYGNPYLQPSYTDNYEFGFSGRFGGYFSTFTLFHRYTTNGLSRIFESFTPEVVGITWTNATTQNNTGIEWVNQMNVGKRLDITLTANAFRADVTAPTNEGVISNTNFSWTTSLLANWRIPKWFNVQLSSNYRGPIVLPQGEIAPIFNADIALRREVLNGNGTVSITLTDVFDTRRFVVQTAAGTFEQERMFNRETRILTVAFTYRFKGYKAKRAEEAMRGNGEGDLFD